MTHAPAPARRRLAIVVAILSGALALVGVAPILAGGQAVARAVATGEPADYYAGAAGQSGAGLHTALHNAIKSNTALSYSGVWTALKVTDADPANPANVIEVYSGTSIDASHQQGSSCSFTSCWNREHTWAQSLGNFDTAAGPGTDLFHMRPEDPSTNSSRGNLDFKDCASGCSSVPNCSVCKRTSTSFEPRASVKGDVARGLFYMAIRYDGGDGFADLELNNQANGSCSSSTC